MWTLHKQLQHCGAQLHARSGPATGSGQPGEAPVEATRDRAAQQHDQADLDAGGDPGRPGAYPASAIENRNQDSTPSAPAGTQDEWDAVVQPERRQHKRDDLPLPEGK